MARNGGTARPGSSEGRERASLRGYRRLRLSVGRHPRDVTLIALAAGVVLACVTFARSVNPVEVAIFSQVQRLPAWSTGFWQAVVWFGSWPSIALAAGLALYLARLRLGLALVLSGAVAWFLAAVIEWVSAPRVPPTSAGLRAPAGGFDFPDIETAVVAALATAVGPYVGRGTRYLLWAVAVLVATGGVFLGESLPLGVFTAAVLGWGTGRFVHLVLGAPGRRPSEEALVVALRESGIEPVRVIPTVPGLLSPKELEVLTRDGDRLDMQLVRRLRRVAGPVHKLRRAAASLETLYEPRLSTPRHEVDHEAYLTLVAERAGVGVVPVLVAGEIDRGPAFLVRRHVEGRPLSALAADAVSDGLLAAVWRDVGRLGALNLAHHDLRAANVLVDEDGRPRISSFTLGRVGGPPEQRAQDAAEMLVSLTSVVGAKRAVGSAERGLSRDDLEESLPYLQWLALHRRIRSQVDKATLTDLRETLAERLDVPPPSFRSPVRASTALMLLAGVGAVYLLLPQLSSMSAVLDSLADANWWWLVATFATGMLAVAAHAVTVLGSTPARLPPGRTLAVQVAAAFTGRTTAAGVGFYGVNLAFLEKLGFRRSHVVGALLLNRAAMGLVTAIGTGLGLLAIGGAVPVGAVSLPTGPVVAGVGAVVVVAVVVLASPVGRRRLLSPAVRVVREVIADLLPVLRKPVRTLELFGGSMMFVLISALGLATTLSAFHVSYPLLPVLAVFVVGTTLGQLAPTPGGLGAVEAALVAGLRTIGVEPTVAVAAVLASRLLTFWLPVVPGVVMFRVLQHRGIV